MDELMQEMNAKAESAKSDSDFYKIHEGANKMRILTDFVRVETIQRGQKYGGMVSDTNKPTADDTVGLKGWTWAIVRSASSDEIKIMQFGKVILGQIYTFKNDPEYKFKDFPMPYDITINAEGAGTKEVKYTTTASRQNTDVTEAEMALLLKKMPIREIVQRIKDKQDGKSRAVAGVSLAKVENVEEPKGEIPF